MARRTAMWLAAITAACTAVAGAILHRRQLGGGHLARALLSRSHQPAVLGLLSFMASLDYTMYLKRRTLPALHVWDRSPGGVGAPGNLAREASGHSAYVYSLLIDTIC